jgi:hypothetical protein
MLGIQNFGLKQPANFFPGEAFLSKGSNQRMNSLLCETNPFGSGFAAPLPRYEGAGAVPDFEQAFVLQFRIGLGDSGMAYDNFFCKRANTWQLIPPLEDTGIYRVPDLLHQL